MKTLLVSLLVAPLFACGTKATELDTPAALCAPGQAGQRAQAPDAGRPLLQAGSSAQPPEVGARAGDAGRPAPPPDAGTRPTGDDDAGTASEGRTIYRLTLVRRYGVPLTNASGVACAGDWVWLIGGGHNAAKHTLVHAALANGEIDATYTFDNLIEQLGTGVYGITQLDGRIYISVAGNTNKLVVVDAQNGAIIKQMQAPTMLGPSDLDVSNGQLFESSGTGTLFALDPRTGAVLRSFDVGSSGRDNGVVVRNGEALVGNLFGGMDVFSLESGVRLGHVTKLDGSELLQYEDLGPMCMNQGKLLVLSSLGLSEYEVRAAD